MIVLQNYECINTLFSLRPNLTERYYGSNEPLVCELNAGIGVQGGGGGGEGAVGAAALLEFFK